MLKISGEGYGLTDTKYEITVDTREDFSVEHDMDMTTIYYGERYLTLKRESFKCESI